MQITIFGASGKVGNLVVEQALQRGYKVIAFVHSHDIFVPDNKLRVVTGDVYNETDVAKAIHGSDAVISCLGSWGTKGRDVLSSAMRTIIPAMQQEKISRIVTLTGSGAKAPDMPESRGHTYMMRLLRPTPAGKVFFDGEEHMRLLAKSSLDWTTIRSPIMTNHGSASYSLQEKPAGPFSTISRQAVVESILDQLRVTDNAGRAPIICKASASSVEHRSKV